MKAAKLISTALIGADFVNVLVNGKMYNIFPPTIERLVGATTYLTDFADQNSFSDIINSIKDSDKLAKILSWLIKGDESLWTVLRKGTFDELVDGIVAGFSLIDMENFMKLSILSRNVSMLIAKAK